MTGNGALSGVSRREFLRLAGMGVGLAALGPSDLVHAAGWTSSDRARLAAGSYTVDVGPMQIDLAGLRVATAGYNGVLPGPEIRITEGDFLQVLVRNHLREGTTIHWHGLPIVNRMDGVPDLTQPAISPGSSFMYRFKVPVSGTYMYHSHFGTQVDRGMYGPLISVPRRETLKYDREFNLMLDDWIDGVSGARKRLASFSRGDRLSDLVRPQGGGMPPGPSGAPMVTMYPYHLINGKPATAPTVMTVRRGDVVRLRIANPSASTRYRVALAGHRMLVTHTDGLPVNPVQVDTLEIATGERYDVLVQANNPGVWQFAAIPDVGPMTRAIFQYAGSTMAAPPPTYRPRELSGMLLRYSMLQAASGVAVPTGRPDVVWRLGLIGHRGSFAITVNGRTMPMNQPIPLPLNRHIRFIIIDTVPPNLPAGVRVSPHPMHLHGHSFRVLSSPDGGPVKDTVIVNPNETVTIDWVSDNPGLWLFHCHHLYHMLSGMMITLDVR